jgi:hypothetical protein
MLLTIATMFITLYSINKNGAPFNKIVKIVICHSVRIKMNITCINFILFKL